MDIARNATSSLVLFEKKDINRGGTSQIASRKRPWTKKTKPVWKKVIVCESYDGRRCHVLGGQ